MSQDLDKNDAPTGPATNEPASSEPAAPEPAAPARAHAPKPTVGASRPKVRVGVGRSQATVAPRRPSQPAPQDVEGVEGDEGRMTSARKSMLFLGLVVVVYVVYLVVSGNMGSFLQALSGVKVGWVVAAALMYGVYYFFGVLAYVLPLATTKPTPLGVRDLMSVEASGIFFSNLTPLGAGGAPAQVFRLVRSGLSVGEAGAVQYTRFLIYEAAEGLFAALMLVFRLQYFYDTYGDVTVIGLLLFGFKVLEVGGLLLVCLFPGWVIRAGNWAVALGIRLGVLKERHLKKWNDSAVVQVRQFSQGFRSAGANWKQLVLTLVVTMLQLACIYSLPWFVLTAFGDEADILTCLAAGSMLELLTSAIPLPGGTGGAEGGFAYLFGSMFGTSVAAGYVVWRMVEYFLPIIAAAPLMGLRSTSSRDNVHELYMRIHNWVEYGESPRRGSGSGRRGSQTTVRPKNLK